MPKEKKYDRDIMSDVQKFAGMLKMYYG